MYINQKKSNSKSNLHYHHLNEDLMYTLNKDWANQSNNHYNNNYCSIIKSHNNSHNLLYLIKIFMIQYVN